MARLVGVDLPRNKRLEIALTYIYGIGPARAKKILEVTGISPDLRTDDLTESDIKKMEEEIEYRKVTLRPQLLEHVKTARAHGDVSENFEYKAAKQEKNRNESRIRYLEKMIRSAVIIDDSSKDDEVGINNTVTVEFEDDHSTAKYKIVTTVRSDSLKGLISIDSPLGKALMKHKIGDKVHVVVDEKIEYDVIIKDIDKSTDDSEDKLRSY